MICFITGNLNKLKEAQAILPGLTNWDVDLPEIQGISAELIIQEKLKAARHLPEAPEAFFIEDTSLYIDCLKGLPGPLVKWFISKQTLGIQGLADLVQKYECPTAQAKTMIGLYSQNQAHFFEGVIEGQIVQPRGSQGFGWDAIFQPQGSTLTFAQMDAAQKQAHSMRRLALHQLQAFLAT